MLVAASIVSFDGAPVGDTNEDKTKWLKSKSTMITDKISSAYNNLNRFATSILSVGDLKNY